MTISTKTCFLLLISIACSQCSYSKKTNSTGTSQPSSTATTEVSQDQILFLTFKIIKDSTLKVGEKIQLVQKQKVDGLLKSKLKTPMAYNVGDLICEYSDKKNTLLYTEIMEDPLTATVEYPAENGTFKRAFLNKKEADLFLRIQDNTLLYKLRISKVMPDGKIQIIADFII